MKKFGFALQVFGLLTTLPLYVILEMNRPVKVPVDNTAPLMIERVEIKDADALQKDTTIDSSFLFGKVPGMLLKTI